MVVLSDKKVLPELFLEVKDFYSTVLTEVKTFKEKILEANDAQLAVQTFFEKYNKYQLAGFNMFKSAMGDFCVGAKALGNKFGAIGGDTFVKLKATAEEVVAKTGEFFNFISSFIVNSEDVLNKSEKNVEKFVNLVNKVEEYLEMLIICFERLAVSTKYLYGDAKNMLGEKFDAISAPLVNFIHMAKVKVVAALANSVVAVKMAYDVFADIVDQFTQFTFVSYAVINENGEVDADQAQAFLDEIVVDFDEALQQAKLTY